MGFLRRSLERLAESLLGFSEAIADAAAQPLPGEDVATKRRRLKLERRTRRAERRRSRRRARQGPVRNALEDARDYISAERRRTREEPTETTRAAEEVPRGTAEEVAPGAPSAIVEGPSDRPFLVAGRRDVVDPEYERHAYATEAEALAAFEDLSDAGVPEDLMAVFYWPKRRFRYVLYVGPSGPV